MIDLIKKLKNSNNELLVSEAESIERWKNLRHSKSDIELFLQFNIAELRFKPKYSSHYLNIICTSNTRFIEVFKAVKEKDKMKSANVIAFDGIRTKDTTTIMTYDLLANAYKTIYLKAWDIVNFVSITPANVLVLDALVNDILHKPVVKSNKNK